MKALAYIRVSTDRQAAQGDSLDAQRARLTAYCIAHQLELVEVISDEGVSGSIPLGERPGGARLLALLGKDGVSIVVTVRIDRMFRNTADTLQTIADFKRADLNLHVLDFGGGSLNTDSALGNFLVTIQAATAQFQRELTRERTNETITYKRSQGHRIGTVPFGFMVVGTDKQLVEIPGRADAIKSMWAMKARGYSLRRIAHIINADFGRQFQISHNTVAAILKQPGA